MVAPADLTSLLEVLSRGGVEFVVVGALAAVAQGAPLTTHDVDIVHERSPENVDRLMAVLARIHARYRGRFGNPPLPPDRVALRGKGHSLFETDLGHLDRLGAIEEGRTFEDVLGLETIVRLKRASTHPKDKLALIVLEETLEQLGSRR